MILPDYVRQGARAQLVCQRGIFAGLVNARWGQIIEKQIRHGRDGRLPHQLLHVKPRRFAPDLALCLFHDSFRDHLNNQGEGQMTRDDSAGKAPPSYWVVAGLGLLWNAFGGYLYLLSKFNPEAAMAGADPAMREYALNMPIWAHLGWSVGIWGSVLGSVLMLVRSRHAVTAFLASLIGALISFAAQGMAGVLPVGLSAGIAGVIAFLWWFCRNEAAKGMLR